MLSDNETDGLFIFFFWLETWDGPASIFLKHPGCWTLLMPDFACVLVCLFCWLASGFSKRWEWFVESCSACACNDRQGNSCRDKSWERICVWIQPRRSLSLPQTYTLWKLISFFFRTSRYLTTSYRCLDLDQCFAVPENSRRWRSLQWMGSF